jgi:hypothetical protein
VTGCLKLLTLCQLCVSAMLSMFWKKASLDTLYCGHEDKNTIEIIHTLKT